MSTIETTGPTPPSAGARDPAGPAGVAGRHWQQLRARLTGRLVLPGAADYADAARARNLNARHRPAAVVQPADAADIRHAVRFAADRGSASA